MAFNKFPSFSTTASVIAMTIVLSGCSVSNPLAGKLFHSKPVTAEATANENYQSSLEMGDKARADGKLEEAAAHYARAARWMPNESWPLLQLGDTLWEMKNPTESAKVLEQAAKVNPGNVLVMRNLGRAYIALNQAGNAQKAYSAALTLDPQDTKTLNGLGIAYDIDGDHATAQKTFRKGLQIEAQNADLANNLAYSLISSQKYSEAIDVLVPIVNKPDATPRQRQNLALAYGLLGKVDDVKRVSSVDLTPAEIEKNIIVYNHLRVETSQTDTLRSIGRPTFESGGLTAKLNKEAAEKVPAAATQSAPNSAEAASDEALAAAPTNDGISAPMTLAPTPGDSDESDANQTQSKGANTARIDSGSVILGKVSVGPKDQTVKAVAPTHVPATELASPASSGPTSTGFGNNKVYLGDYDTEAAAREAWIKVWVNNSTALSNMAASMEPNSGRVSLYAIGASSPADAAAACEKLHSNGVSCGSK